MIVFAEPHGWKCWYELDDAGVHTVELLRLTSGIMPRILVQASRQAAGSPDVRVLEPTDETLIGPSGHEYRSGLESRSAQFARAQFEAANGGPAERRLVLVGGGTDVESSPISAGWAADLILSLSAHKGSVDSETLLGTLSEHIPIWKSRW